MTCMLEMTVMELKKELILRTAEIYWTKVLVLAASFSLVLVKVSH